MPSILKKLFRDIRVGLAFWLAGEDLYELLQWRESHVIVDRWLGEFPDAKDAAEYMHRFAVSGNQLLHPDVFTLRQEMRKRRDAAAGANLGRHLHVGPTA